MHQKPLGGRAPPEPLAGVKGLGPTGGEGGKGRGVEKGWECREREGERKGREIKISAI